METLKKEQPVRDIKQYLHLYLGCDCTMIDGDQQERKFMLNAYNLNYYRQWTSDLRPILRKLSSMTDTEVIDLVKIMLDKDDVHVIIERTEEKDFVIATYNTVYPESGFDRDRFDKILMHLTISDVYSPCSLRNNWDYVKDNSTGVTNQQLFRHHDMTRYLLSKHFDLFNLIESKLAIEKQ